MPDNGTSPAPVAEDTATPADDQAVGTPADGAPAPEATAPEATTTGDDTPAVSEPQDDDHGDAHGDDATAAHDDGDDDGGDGEVPAVWRRNLSKARREAANLRDRAKAAEARAKAAEADALKWRVGAEAGLEPALIKRLQGSAEAELLADAEELLELYGRGRRTTPPGVPAEVVDGRRGAVDPDELAAAESDLSKIGARMYDR